MTPLLSLNTALTDNLAPVLTALADPTRFRLVRLLLERDLCVSALARELAVSEPAVSQHVKKLKECGLIIGEKRSYFMHYRVNTDLLLKASDDLRQLAARQRSGEGECARRKDGGECCCPARQGQGTLRELTIPDCKGGDDD